MITPTALAGVMVVEPRRFDDMRGWFMETWSEAATSEAFGGVRFVQDNQSLSRAVGTVRGLHFQLPPHAQAKLVRVVRGAILDVAVDIRAGSPTFGQHVAVELSAANARQLFVPPGFAHGFITREPDTEVAYKVSDIYAPSCEGGLLWNDPDLGIDWGPEAVSAVVADRDRSWPALKDLVALPAEAWA